MTITNVLRNPKHSQLTGSYASSYPLIILAELTPSDLEFCWGISVAWGPTSDCVLFEGPGDTATGEKEVKSASRNACRSREGCRESGEQSEIAQARECNYIDPALENEAEKDLLHSSNAEDYVVSRHAHEAHKASQQQYPKRWH